MRFLFALFVITGVIAAMPQQAPSLPSPSGRYAVARTAIYWTDRNRSEVFTALADDYRELTAFIWYPTRSSQTNYATYLPESDRLSSSKAAAALANIFGPNWPPRRTRMLPSQPPAEAPMANTRCPPRRLFSPGSGPIPHPWPPH